MCGKDSKCHICQVIYTPTFWYANVAFIISAPYLLLSFTFLRYICMEQICANPFFRPVKVAILWTSYKSSTGSFFHFLPLLQLSLLKPDNSSFGAVYDKLKRESSFKVLLGNSPNSRHVKPELGVWSDKTSRAFRLLDKPLNPVVYPSYYSFLPI